MKSEFTDPVYLTERELEIVRYVLNSISSHCDVKTPYALYLPAQVDGVRGSLYALYRLGRPVEPELCRFLKRLLSSCPAIHFQNNGDGGCEIYLGVNKNNKIGIFIDKRGNGPGQFVKAFLIRPCRLKQTHSSRLIAVVEDGDDKLAVTVEPDCL